ncbi:hypothetical protein KEM56_006995 [Ascosphaera pollenicola]|nr:hypothetical protein KEM56_006995 [Ascosphaera pollenicola]
MRFSIAKNPAVWGTTLLGASLAFSHAGTDALVTTDSVNQVGTTYTAVLLQSPASQVRGAMTVAAGTGGVGVSLTLMLTGLPGPEEESYGESVTFATLLCLTFLASLHPFFTRLDASAMAPLNQLGGTRHMVYTCTDSSTCHVVYHINTLPVPEDGNCEATGGILDPFNAGVTADCKITNPSACRVGDLSSKHGPLSPYNYLSVYNDDYLSLNTENPAFLGNRSIVVSMSNGTAVNCGNFTLLGEAITRPLPLNPPPLGRPVETFSEPSLPAQDATTFPTETVEVLETRSFLATDLNTEQTSATVTSPSVVTRPTAVATGDINATGLAAEHKMPCASQKIVATALMTGTASAPAGVAHATGSNGIVLCTAATTSSAAAYHSPTVSSPASDARSIQLGRTHFVNALVVVVEALLAAFF